MRRWLMIAVLALAGCANAPAGNPQTESQVYPITENQAQKVITDSLRQILPGRVPVKIGNGYQSRMWFAIDNHRIRGFYYSAKGRRSDGTIVPGFRFEVRHSGTMPITGSRRARHLHRAIHLRAAAIAPSLPQSQ